MKVVIEQLKEFLLVSFDRVDDSPQGFLVGVPFDPQRGLPGQDLFGLAAMFEEELDNISASSAVSLWFFEVETEVVPAEGEDEVEVFGGKVGRVTRVSDGHQDLVSREAVLEVQGELGHIEFVFRGLRVDRPLFQDEEFERRLLEKRAKGLVRVNQAFVAFFGEDEGFFGEDEGVFGLVEPL